MSFIGIIAENKDFKFLKNIVSEELKENNSKVEIININSKNVDNIKNVRFETIIICSSLDKFECQQESIKNILSNIKYLIINSDIQNEKNILPEELKFEIITYGLNQKATITASSINEDDIIICLQRNIKNIKNRVVEANEFDIKLDKDRGETIYNVLACFSILLMYNGMKI